MPRCLSGCQNTHVFNTCIVSLAFFLQYVAFNTAQSFATSVNPLLGSISLALLYAAWILSLLTASSHITLRLGPKHTLFLSSLIYCGYIASSIQLVDWIYLLTAVLLGIFAGPLWVAQGLITQLSCNLYELESSLAINSKLGFFTGIFTFGYLVSKFVGSLAAALVFELDGSNTLLYSILTVINVIAAFAFLLINGNLKKQDIKRIHTRIESQSTLRGLPPVTPQTPNTPNTPNLPKTPNSPDTPEILESPESPETLETPQTPGAALTTVDSTEISQLVAPAGSEASKTSDPVSKQAVAISKETKASSAVSEDAAMLVMTDTCVDIDTKPAQTASKPETSTAGEAVGTEDKSARDKFSFSDAVVKLKESDFRFLVVIGIEWGVMTAWIASDFSALISNKTLKFYVLAVEGFVSGVFSIIVGYFGDWIGPLPIFLVCNMAGLIAFGVLFFAIEDEGDTGHIEVWLWCVLAVLIGLGDAGYYMAVPHMFPTLMGHKPYIFALMRFLLALGMCCTFAYYTFFDFHTRLLVNIVLSVLGPIFVVAPSAVRAKLLADKSDTRD